MSKFDKFDNDRSHDGRDDDEVMRPVLSGLIALVSVTLAVGLVLGGGALLASRVLGLSSGSEAGSGSAAGGSTLYMPEPEETSGPGEPMITLGPGAAPDASETGSPRPTKAPEGIVLTASPATAAAMASVTLAGTYPTGEGAILQVQRQDGAGWSDFPVVVSVVDGRFSTSVQSALVGPNVFRVLDSDTGTASKPVRFTVQ